jgi:hypothetical protein
MNNDFNNMNNNGYNGYNGQPVQPQQPMNNMGYSEPIQPGYQPGYNPEPQNNYNSYNDFNTTGTTSQNNNKSLVAIIGVVIILIVGYLVYTNVFKKDKMIGTWACTGTGTMKFDFNKNDTFKIHNKGVNENYIKGKYTKKSTTGSNSSYTYYEYKFTASETYMNGTTSTKAISQTYIVGVDSEGKNATIVAKDGTESYVCTK